MIPKKITQPNCLTLIRDQCFQILDSSFCWSSCFEALLVQGTIETIYCITFLWIIRFILHIWPHHEANLRFVLVAGHWKYWVFLTVLLCACTFKGTSFREGSWHQNLPILQHCDPVRCQCQAPLCHLFHDCWNSSGTHERDEWKLYIEMRAE